MQLIQKEGFSKIDFKPYGRATAMPLVWELNEEILELTIIKLYKTYFFVALHLLHCELSTSKWRYRLPSWRHHVIPEAPNHVFWNLLYNLFRFNFQSHSKLFFTKYILILNPAFTMKKCCDKIINNRGRILKSETFIRHGTWKIMQEHPCC